MEAIWSSENLTTYHISCLHNQEYLDLNLTKVAHLFNILRHTDFLETFRLLSKTLKIIIQKTTVLPLVLYGCETWFLTLREQHRLRVFKNRVLRRILGPKMEKVTRKWGRLYNEELHSLYASPDIISVIKSRRMILADHVARMGK
jgi:hypothetical protein